MITQVFYRQSTTGTILLVVYVDDIVITGSDYVGISFLKSFLHTRLHWEALEQILCYLKGVPRLGILYSNHGHTPVECFADVD